jgi:hypothetical protein
MSRKLAVSLLLVMLGLATWDAVTGEYGQNEATIGATDDGEVRAKFDGVGAPPPDRP